MHAGASPGSCPWRANVAPVMPRGRWRAGDRHPPRAGIEPRRLRQLFIENLMLAAIGLAVGGSRCPDSPAIPDQFPAWAHFDIDARVIASLVSVVGAVLFCWAGPARRR
jgi:hypothetical protein